MKIISYNIINNEKQIHLFLEENTGEYQKEVSNELFEDISDQNNSIPFKINSNNEIIVDETQLRINTISQELEDTKWIIDEVNEYHANQEKVPNELLDILAQRKILKEELIELED